MTLQRILEPRPATSVPRTIGRIALGAMLAFAGMTHLTVARKEFRAQVPEWVPVDEDLVVVGSGIAEITLGTALVALPRRRVAVGLAVAAFFVAIFPGNISQYVTRTSAFRLNSDRARFVRLFFQPVLVAWALWGTGALAAVRPNR
ncbi:putative membrane protein [Leifsonia sp. AK011]|uniref:DoxX family protein n=1 Tax=Leifsonia sp. AK011 TaxID=2723075 RepID=UPI0015CC7FB1|nr:hypothetical protein [Leifsonia sp. AK011]NYF10144.1 putative membrane protein [Leifsonia sp. AK011]